jgi:hypothetical protein
VYLNQRWMDSEGGALRCYPHRTASSFPVGSHDGNLQVGWLYGSRPVFRSDEALYCCADAEHEYTELATLHEPGQRTKKSVAAPVVPVVLAVLALSFTSATTMAGSSSMASAGLSAISLVWLAAVASRLLGAPSPTMNADSPSPRFKLKCPKGAFEQISTNEEDQRVSRDSLSPTTNTMSTDGEAGRTGEAPAAFHVDVLPVAGTLVLFDSVCVPHLVRDVSADRQRIAATGWFHEDSQVRK